MYYLGIDIGKNNHEAGLLNEEGAHIGKSLRFSNRAEGFEELLTFLAERLPDGQDIRIAMEATGHYWLALYSFLHRNDYVIHVINPIV
jgi:transposase